MIIVQFETAVLAKKKGYVDKYSVRGYDLKTKEKCFDIDWQNNKNAIPAPTQEQLLTFLESKRMYIAIDPELHQDRVCWSWQLRWYEPEDNHDAEDFWAATGWFGTQGEYPTRKEAQEAAICMGLEYLEPVHRLDSIEKLAKAYHMTYSNTVDSMNSIKDEIGEYFFNRIKPYQIDIFVEKFGHPYQPSKKSN